MPFYEPQSLSDREVYALTAYVLYLNDLVDYDQEINQGNLAEVQMPNSEGFFEDPRPDVANTPCMQNCKEPADIKITWDSTELGVKPVSHFKEEDADVVSAAVQERVVDGAQVYDQACKTCHSVGLAGAPRVGVAADWSERKAQGMEVLIDHAINGFQGKSGYMPPRGGQSQLSDAEIEAAVNHMVSAGG
jgi:cytochrome c